MRILSAFDKFKDSFSAQDACALVKEVASDVSSRLEVISCPLTDGGEGFVEILTPKYEGEIIKVPARDSIGREKIVEIGMVSIERLSSSVRTLLDLPPTGKLAVLEMASVCGLSDLQPEQRNPWRTSTIGVGDLLLHAKANEADCILLGIGGSSTNDAGIGALCALGMECGKLMVNRSNFQVRILGQIFPCLVSLTLHLCRQFALLAMLIIHCLEKMELLNNLDSKRV